MASDNTVFYFGPGRTDPSPIVSRFTQENELGEGDGQEFWRQVLNDVLAKGEQLF